MELRWLVIHSSKNDGTHPSAFLDNMPGYIRVLQYADYSQRYIGGDTIKEWKDIPMVYQKNENL